MALGLIEDDVENVHDDVLHTLLQSHSMRLVGGGDLDGTVGSSKSLGERFEISASFFRVVVVKRHQAHRRIRPQSPDG